MTARTKIIEWIGWTRTNASRLSLLICLLTAVGVTFSLYPGWLFFDSGKQWEWARQIAEMGLPHQLKDYIITSHWPIFNTLMKVPFYKLTGEAGSYILVQAILFNIGIYLVGCAILGRKSIWLLIYTLVMVLSPITMNYSVFHSSDTIVAVCALICVAMICDDTLGMRSRIWLMATSAIMMSLVRYNALPAAILLVGVFSWFVKADIGGKRSLMLMGSISAAILLCVGSMRAYEHTAYMQDSIDGGISERLLAASYLTSDPVIHALTDPYVRLNPRLRKPLEPECYAHGMWCTQFVTPWRGLSNRECLRAYLHLLLHHPIVFAKVNSRFAAFALGFAAPLEPKQIGRADIAAPFPSARMVFNHRRIAFFNGLRRTLGMFDSFAARAGDIWLLGLAAALCLRRRRMIIALVALSIGYLAPLLLLVATNNYRYTLPVTIVAMAITAGACCILIRHLCTGRNLRELRG